MMCGKIASGKSTLARQLAAAPRTVLLPQDALLATLCADQMTTGADYLRCAARVNDAVGPLVTGMLRAGVSVVMDFPANTPDQRAWLRGLADVAGVAHRVHLLNAGDDLCLKRLHHRNATGDHPFHVSDAQFHRFTAHFSVPSAAEGLVVEAHG